MSDALIHEIDEELRRDRALALWKKHGRSVMALVVVCVAGIGLWRGYAAYEQKNAQRRGDQLFDVMVSEAALAPEQVATLTSLNREKGGSALLARFRLAAAQAGTGKKDEALQVYKALAADKAATQPLRDFATIRAALLLLDLNRRSELKQILAAFASDTHPYRHSAYEILGLAAYQAQEKEEAARYFEKITTAFNAPKDVRNRAQVMANVLESEGVAVRAPPAVLAPSE